MTNSFFIKGLVAQEIITISKSQRYFTVSYKNQKLECLQVGKLAYSGIKLSGDRFKFSFYAYERKIKTIERNLKRVAKAKKPALRAKKQRLLNQLLNETKACSAGVSTEGGNSNCHQANRAKPAVAVSNFIKKPTNWSGHIYVSGVVSVEAPLLISPCTVIEFGASGKLKTYTNLGIIKATGAVGKEIIFTAKSSDPLEYWDGIDLSYSNSDYHAFEYVVIEKVSLPKSDFGAGLMLDTNNAFVKDVTFNDIRGRAVNVNEYGIDNFVFKNVKFNNVTGELIKLDVMDLPKISAFTLKDPKPTNVVFLHNYLDQDLRIKKLGAPYVFSFRLWDNTTLQVDPGVNIILEDGNNFEVDGGANLQLLGTATQRIKVSEDYLVPNKSTSIIFENAGQNNIFQYVDFYQTGNESSTNGPITIYEGMNSKIDMKGVRFMSRANNAYCDLLFYYLPDAENVFDLGENEFQGCYLYAERD